MLKKYITIAGVIAGENISIVDGDREIDQGSVLLIIIDMHLEVSTIFKMIKRQHPNAILLSSGIFSMLSKNNIIIIDGNTSDQFILDSYILGEQLAVIVTIRNCYYSKKAITINSLTTTYPIGKLDKVLSIVSLLS